MLKNTLVPSAKNINSSPLELEQAGRSFIYIIKKRVPSIEPCGTPQICLKASDLESPIWT